MKKEGARGDKKKVLSRVRRQKTFSISSNRVLLSLSPLRPATRSNQLRFVLRLRDLPLVRSPLPASPRLASQARALDPFTTETFPVSTFRLYVSPPPKRKAPFGITTDAARRSIGEGGDTQTGIMPRPETLLFPPSPLPISLLLLFCSYFFFAKSKDTPETKRLPSRRRFAPARGRIILMARASEKL